MADELIPGEQPLWGDNGDMAKRSSTAELTFKYEGAAVADGTMDMADFGRALIGYTKVVDAVVKEISPTSQVTEVRLERTEKGSFSVIASVVQDVSLVQSVKDFLTGNTGIALVGGITITTGLGTIIGKTVSLGKRLRGRKIESREPALGAIDEEVITTPDGEQIQAPTPVINVTQNYYFNDGMQDVIEPTKRPGVDTLKMPASDGEEVELDASDAISFAPRIEDGIETQIVKDAILEIERAAFDGGMWRFARIFDDDRVPQSLNAIIEDERFLQNVEHSQTAFKKKDRIRATLETTISKPRGKRAVYHYVVSQVHDVLPFTPPDPIPGL